MIISYSIVVGISILLVAGYPLLVKKREGWMVSLFFSVLVANFGYLLESVAESHTVAVVANDLAYLGAISVMLSTLILVEKLCGFTPRRRQIAVLAALAFVMFAIVAIHPVLPLYYKSTWLEVVDGATVLKKDYGVLYGLYKVYIFSYLAAMVTFIIVSLKKHRIHSYKMAILLFFVATVNCIVWRVQRWIGSDFNLLCVSYIFGALVLLYLFWMMQDYVHAQEATPEPVIIEKVVYVTRDKDSDSENYTPEQVASVLCELESTARLTETEIRVLQMLLEEHTRKEISHKLSVSENTIKSHVSHIYAKLGVGSKEELRAIFAKGVQNDA